MNPVEEPFAMLSGKNRWGLGCILSWLWAGIVCLVVQSELRVGFIRVAVHLSCGGDYIRSVWGGFWIDSGWIVGKSLVNVRVWFRVVLRYAYSEFPVGLEVGREMELGRAFQGAVQAGSGRHDFGSEKKGWA